MLKIRRRVTSSPFLLCTILGSENACNSPMNTPLAILMIVGPILAGLFILNLAHTATIAEAIRAWLWDVCIVGFIILSICSVCAGGVYLVNTFK